MSGWGEAYQAKGTAGTEAPSRDVLDVPEELRDAVSSKELEWRVQTGASSEREARGSTGWSRHCENLGFCSK